MQISEHLGNRLVTVLLNGGLLSQTVHAFHHPVGLGRVRLRCPMLNLLLLAELLKIMRVFDFCAPAVLKALEGKRAPIISQDFADLERKEQKTAVEKICGGLLVLVRVDKKKRKETTGGSHGQWQRSNNASCLQVLVSRNSQYEQTQGRSP